MLQQGNDENVPHVGIQTRQGMWQMRSPVVYSEGQSLENVTPPMLFWEMKRWKNMKVNAFMRLKTPSQLNKVLVLIKFIFSIYLYLILKVK